MYDKYEDSFPKLSKVNSLVADGVIFYFKSDNGSFVAWEYKTKIKIVATNDKERLKKWLVDNIVEIKRRLLELGS